jgi:hypothetical protein
MALKKLSISSPRLANVLEDVWKEITRGASYIISVPELGGV